MPVEIFGYVRPPAVHSPCSTPSPSPSVAAMHPTDDVPNAVFQVDTRALREAAAAMGDGATGGAAVPPADDLLAALTVLSRDASAGWASVRAAATTGHAAAADACRLAESIVDMMASLRSAADAYDGVDERVAGQRLRPGWAGPQVW